MTTPSSQQQAAMSCAFHSDCAAEVLRQIDAAPSGTLARTHIAAALDAALAAAWAEGYGQGRDDESDGLPLRENPYR